MCQLHFLFFFFFFFFLQSANPQKKKKLLPNLKPRHGYMCRGFFISIELITGGVANPTCQCTALVMLITQQAPA